MQGDVLYPLNRLKNVFPDRYSIEVAKYDGREHIMDQKVPLLECLWNDVLHLSAINPDDIVDTLKQLGIHLPHGVRYYQIDPFILEKEKTIIYTKVSDDKIDFSVYDPEKIVEISVLPESTKEYYRDEISNNRKPLIYYQTPHILYKGSIDISDCTMKIMR